MRKRILTSWTTGSLFLISVCLRCPVLSEAPQAWAKHSGQQEIAEHDESESSARFVGPAGNDADDGTAGHPWATLRHADDVAKPGDTVVVLDGTYRGSVVFASSGTASQPITYRAQHKWKAKLLGTGSGRGSSVVGVSGGHVIVQGFDITGSEANGIVLASYGSIASHNSAVENYVHDLVVPCNSDSGTAIETGGGDNYHGITHNDMIGNLVVNITPLGGCLGGHQASGLFAEAPFSVIANNTVINAGYGIQCWHAASNITIVGNTLINNIRGITVGAGDAPYGKVNDYTRVQSNIIYNSKELAIAETGRTGTHNEYTDNLIFGGDTSVRLNNGLRALRTIIAEPRFVRNTGTASGDYHLRRKSPAPRISQGKQPGSAAVPTPSAATSDPQSNEISAPPISPAAGVTASTTSVGVAQPVTIFWKTKDAVTAKLNGTPVALNGSLVVRPTVTTSYRLDAAGPTGKTDWGSVTIHVQ